MKKILILIFTLWAIQSIFAEFRYEFTYAFEGYRNNFATTDIVGAEPVNQENINNNFASSLNLKLGFSDKYSLGAEFTSSTSLIPFVPEIIEKDRLFRAMEISLKIFRWKSLYQRQTRYMDLAVTGGIGIYRDGELLTLGDEFQVYQIYDILYFIDLVQLFDGSVRKNLGKYSGRIPSIYLGVAKCTEIGQKGREDEIDVIHSSWPANSDIDRSAENWGGAIYWDMRGIAEFPLGEKGYIDYLHNRITTGFVYGNIWIRSQVGISMGQILENNMQLELYPSLNFDGSLQNRSEPLTFKNGPLAVSLEGSISYANYQRNSKEKALH